MKYFILLFCATILFNGSICGQSTLEVNIKDCREKVSFEYLSEFKLYKNDSLIKTIQPKHQSKQIIKDLEQGNYRIEYKTMFGKTENVSIEITEKKKYTTDLCLNYINHNLDNYTPLISQLKDGESYSIEISSQGCFHWTNETLTIKKKSNEYILLHNKTKRKLTEQEINAIIKFEIELNYMESVGCTTTDTYLVKYKNREIKIVDGSCAWMGSYYLMKNLNLKKE